MAVHFQQPRVEAERLLKLGHLKMVTQRVRDIKEKEKKKSPDLSWSHFVKLSLTHSAFIHFVCIWALTENYHFLILE